MSVFLSIAVPEAALLLTDGASYDDQGVVRKIGRKVFTSHRSPVAVTARGHGDGGEILARALCGLADDLGAQGLLDHLQAFANETADAFNGRFTGEDGVQILVAAFIPGVGGVHRSFSSVQTPQGFDQPAWHVFEPPAVFATGQAVDGADMVAAGIAPRQQDEPMTGYLARAGADILEVMRRRPAAVHGTDRMIYGVGGMAEMTTIDADGARTVTLRTWPDRVGELIRP